MNFNILKQELLSGPYDGMTDQEAADSMNQADINVVGRVDAVALNMWSASIDGKAKLEKAIDDKKSTSKYAQAALDAFNNPKIPDINLSNPDVAAMFDGLVTDSVITQDEKDALVAAATTTISRAEQLGLPKVRLWQVKWCREEV